MACLTSGYSKTLANDAAAVSPCTSPTTIAFGRMTLRGTPAEALGPTDHAWSIGELLNWPNPQIPLAETLGALGKVKREGLARHVGVSNFTVALIEQALRETYDNEREVGEGLRASGVKRAEVFVTTKIWPSHFAPRELERAARDCLTRLRLSEVDLLLLRASRSFATRSNAIPTSTSRR